MPTALSSFTNEIALSAPGAPNILVEHFLRNAAIAFCNATNYITEDLPAVSVLAGDTDLTLTVDSSEEIVSVTQAYADGRPLEPVSEIQLQRDVGEWKSRTGTPTHFLSNNNVIRLYPTPSADLSLLVTVSKRPSRTAVTVDDRLYAEWREAMVSGALSGLMMTFGQPFSDPTMAAVFRASFNDWIVGAQAKAFKKTSYAPMRVSPI
jgi:hypothetical protein